MPDDVEQLRAALAQRFGSHDRDGAIAAAMQAVQAGVPIVALYEVLRQLLVDIGASWQSGWTHVWEEHLATATVRTIVEACAPLVPAQAQPSNGRTVVLTTPHEEYHDLGMRMLADAFRLAGWRAHLLGASLPVTEVVAAARALGADAVALSAATHFHRLQLQRYVAELAHQLDGVQLWVGGAAFAHGHEGWPDEQVLRWEDVAHAADRMGA